MHGTTNWEYTPLYFKEMSWVGSNAFGIEEVDGVRKHGIHHYLDLVARRGGSTSTACSPTPSRSTTTWRDAFEVLATQDGSGAIKVAFDQRRTDPDHRTGVSSAARIRPTDAGTCTW